MPLITVRSKIIELKEKKNRFLAKNMFYFTNF